MNKPLILVTNDDGVYAKGLSALIEAAKPYGKVVVVAPADSQSGMSHAISVKHPIRVELISDTDGITFYKCFGTPVDCIKISINQLFKGHPDLILSGINHGANSAASVLYSGTMAAALEGCLNGIPSIGFSLLSFSPTADFGPAIQYCQKIIENALKNKIPDAVCLNVNIPAVALDEIKGIKVCRQTKGHWVEEFDKRIDPHGRDYYWLTGSFNNLEPEAEDSDEWVLKHNYVSVVPTLADFTSHQSIDVIKKWNL
jgi:5'-nucleotidase